MCSASEAELPLVGLSPADDAAVYRLDDEPKRRAGFSSRPVRGGTVLEPEFGRRGLVLRRIGVVEEVQGYT
jgi:hypothetical protein